MGFDPRAWFSRKTLRRDLVAGLTLGVESVPDGLAQGLLSGLNPLAGLYGHLFGMVGAALFTSSALMTVQVTGAMALIVSDAGLETLADPDRALYTLTIMSGVILVAAGLLGAGRLVRFVPTAVMTGFVTAVGVNIVLGQLSNFTGYASHGGNRIVKTIDLVVHVRDWSLAAVVVGTITVLIIVLLQNTRVGALALVVAVVVGSIAAVMLDLWVATPVTLLRDLVAVPGSLPTPVLPSLDDVGFVLLPAISLAFVAMVQGAGVSSGIPTRDGKPADTSRDFIGQGAGNIVSGLFRGMPVGGSSSGSALVATAGARTRLVYFVAGVVMSLVILLASGLVAYIAMPALAGLLIVVGVTAIKPSRVYSVIRSGPLPTVVMAVTFVLTLLIPLQFAVLAGVGLGIIMFVAQQSNRVRVRRVVFADDGRMREIDPPAEVPPNEIVVLQPYGSLFFASAPTFERQLPEVTPESTRSIVIVRLRGTDEVGLAFVEVLRRYAHELRARESSLKLVVSEARVIRQLEAGGLRGEMGEANIYRGSEWVGAALRRAYDDAREELRAEPRDGPREPRGS
ncbi:SulP family inorganic anion transporter [Microbacterium jejuense]|uniref:SulP family inorganic anion transporter n=1 Tax=Microbacterium jejuense TaxID=1263637 RepID=A0ABS7HU64_9MICO|nr:SulP family inorganic anion transporter [Microbacterium jejuense]MBW9095727.1 SulP family inorganic anion transporter [Microbacterium jejuense]